MCKRRSEWKHRSLASNESKSVAGMEFQAWYHVLEKVYIFKYLERIISFDDKNWPVLAWKLQRHQRKWGWFYCMMFWEELPLEPMVGITCQWFILWFSLDQSCVLSPPHIIRALRSLHNRVVQRNSICMPWCRNGCW